MAVDIRYFIHSHLLEPLKQYPTVIQDTMIELIVEKLQLLYDYTYQFPEILSPNQNRIDILKAIADQFLFTVRTDADLQEQIDILDHILSVYSKRGSIDTIENMWKYYGGTLPKDIEVIIPSYNLFRYSISKLSGTHVFQDNTVNRTGVYEIKLTNNTYPIPDLRDFLIKELVAAGNYFYFTNTLHNDILSSIPSSNPYKYLIDAEDLLQIQMMAVRSHHGFTFSGINPLNDKLNSYWSGKESILFEITKIFTEEIIDFSSIDLTDDLGVLIAKTIIAGDSEIIITDEGGGKTLYNLITSAAFIRKSVKKSTTHIYSLYCTLSCIASVLDSHLYNDEGELLESRYPGYFIVGETLLGEEIV